MLIAIYAYEDCYCGSNGFFKTAITRVEDRNEAAEIAYQMSLDIIHNSDSILDILRDDAYEIAVDEGAIDIEDRMDELIEVLIEDDTKYEVYHIKENENQALIDFHNYTDIEDFLDQYEHTLILSE